MIFVCPKCNMVFSESSGSAVKCPNGHSFDRAREGYLNLLLSNGGGAHGDNREMVEARRSFLDTGAYFPLAKKVSELAEKYYAGENILDIGCGEGYYTNIIFEHLLNSGKSFSLAGFDISKDAVRRCAKRNKSFELAVASAYKMPVSDSTVDLAFNMFSPLALSETLRVLRENGIFIMAIPGMEHLWGLKAATYQTPYKNEVSDSCLEGFSLIETCNLKYNLHLKSSGEIKSLFMMTPYAYRTKKEDRERVLSLSSLETTIEFIIFVYRKISNEPRRK